MNNTDHLEHYGVLGMKWGVHRSRNGGNVHDDYAKAHTKKSVKEMSDSELRSRNNRLQMEQQYYQLSKRKNRGQKVVKSLIATAGTIAAAEGAYKTYKGIAEKAVNALGDYVISDLKKGLTKGF